MSVKQWASAIAEEMAGMEASHSLPDTPSPWVARFAPLIPPGEVLDLACGSGRHARLVAGLGHPVLAVDRDPSALARTAGPGITLERFDLERDEEAERTVWPFGRERFAGIVVTNYLHRPLFPNLLRSLVPGGILIYETFAQGNELFGKPSNPAFLLKEGELLRLVSMVPGRVIAYEDGYVAVPKPAMVQRICYAKAPLGQVPEHLRLT